MTEIPLAVQIPAGTGEGAAGIVTVNAVSLPDSASTAAASVYVLNYQPILTAITVNPEGVSLLRGETHAFTAAGTDQFSRARGFRPVWSATGGDIDADGVYTAGNTVGTFMVSASDEDSEAVGQALVNIVSEIATEVDEALPAAFQPHPNRPNPFKPTTTVSYDVAEAVHVRLVVYDPLGRRVGGAF